MNYDTAKNLIKAAKSIAVFTGAGISTDSGIPDFRGPNGVWTKDPAREKSSTIKNFKTSSYHRKEAWQDWLFNPLWATAKPNAGHLALADLSVYKPTIVITQNIDGLHWCEGNLFKDKIELHGTRTTASCMNCGEQVTAQEALNWFKETNSEDFFCYCGGLMKPNVIFFGEDLSPVVWTDATNAVINSDILLVVGTSLQVWPAADLVDIAHKWGKQIIIVNGSATKYDGYANVVLRGSISEILKELVDEHINTST